MNPYAITIHCDGAMSYDAHQTGGNGFIIEFPESINLHPVTKFFRNDEQGIQRLEMISIFESMKELENFGRKNEGVLRKAGGIVIYTDRFSATDEKLLNPYSISKYRSNGWKTHEGKPVKDKDLLDKIDKMRKKLSRIVGGRIEIKYKKEKQNKTADKLSRLGRKSALHSKSTLLKKIRHVAPRKFDGQEIDYSLIFPGKEFLVHVYSWESVQKQFEVIAEVLEGDFFGKKIKIYSDGQRNLHRRHYYKIVVGGVYRHHIEIADFTEVAKDEALKLVREKSLSEATALS